MAAMNESVETGVPTSSATLHPRMNWSAIVAGWLVATAIAGLLYMAGLALGFAAFNPYDMAGAATGIGIGTAIWLVLTWAAGLFIGGMFASWFDGQSDETMGSMHGIAVWGLSVTATALWLSLGPGQALHHRAPADGPGSTAVGAAAISSNDALLILQANVRSLVNRPQRDVPPAASDAIVAAILADRTDTARALLMADGAPLDAIDQALPRLATEAIAANAKIKADAERTAHYTSMALWVAFLSGLLALLAASIGGWLGAGNVHRVYHLRRYEGRPYRAR